MANPRSTSLLETAEALMKRGQWGMAIQAINAGATSRADCVLRQAQLHFRMDCVNVMEQLLEYGPSRNELFNTLSAQFDEHVAAWALDEYRGLKLLRR